MLFRGVGVIIWVISATIGIGFAVVRYNVLDAYLPTELASALEAARAKVGGFSDAGAVTEKRVAVASAGEGPESYLVDGPEGVLAEGPIAAMAGNFPVFIDDVLSGHRTQVENDIPAEITMIRPISGCRLTPPLEGTRVGHVTASAPGPSLPLLTYDDEDLASGVQALVDSYRDGDAAGVAAPANLAFEAYDVAVTETRVPVYLVLESGAGNRIWNIHLAPGARVERVVLLGGAHVGVANLDPVVPVEVLPGPALQACNITPAYPLNAGNRLFQMLIGEDGTAKAEAEVQLSVIKDRIAAYNIWFRDSFGVVSDETRAGFDGGSVSVVGSQPGKGEPKAVYVPIDGSRIRMTQDSYFEIRGQVAEGEDFAGRVKAITTSFASGDLKSLRQGVAF